MRQINATIIENKNISRSMYKMTLDLKGQTVKPLPGQFFTLRITPSIMPLLRRPFAFSGFSENSGSISFIYQIRGNGTTALSSFSQNTEVDIIGPLGKPFPMPELHQSALLVAGGIGLGPILFLANNLLKAGTDFKIIFGCRSSDFIPFSVFNDLSVALCTDDGSSGFHGTVVNYIETLGNLPKTTILYCCGPHPMLHACSELSKTVGIPCYVSVEQTMACGVGACMGCVIKTTTSSGYLRACKDGPVFDARIIQW